MFNGIIEDIGTLRSKEILSGSKMIRLIFESNLSLGDSKIGESIAVNGACLTLLETSLRHCEEDRRSDEAISLFLTQVSPETAEKTNLANLEIGDRVNLERGMKIGERFNGHMVLGHIDSRIRRLHIDNVNDGAVLWYELPEEFRRYFIIKGSVALNGVSLTINEIEESRFSLFLLPHSIRNTNLLDNSSGWVNLEVDIIGKYIERFMSGQFDLLHHPRESGDLDSRFRGNDMTIITRDKDVN